MNGAAIWWQDRADPVACMIHGPRGTDDVLLDAFYKHDYRLTPAPPSPG